MAIDMDGLKDRVNDFADKASDVAEDLGEQARPYVEQAADRAGGLFDKAKPHAERARDWAVGVMDKAFDFLEERTGTDLDRDGVIGAAVREAAEIEVALDVDEADEADEAAEDEEPLVEDPDE